MNELNLEVLDIRPLELEESLRELLDGNILLIAGYEKTQGKDILVRLSQGKYPKTEITYDLDSIRVFGVEDYKPYWSTYNVPINALVFYNVYKFEGTALQDIKYLPGTTVYYHDSEGRRVASTVLEVLRDSEGKLYYNLSSPDNRVYEEKELS